LGVACWFAGFKVKTVHTNDDGITWSYLDNDCPSAEPVVVFLHGFSSVKESMLRLATPLKKTFRILIPDLPGHGHTTGTTSPLTSFRAVEQATRLNHFLQATLHDRQIKIHLIGCSMGGLITGVYAATFPARVASVTLICPAGITMPQKSELYHIYETTGENYMRANTVEEFERLARFLFHRKPKMPRFLMNAIVQERVRSIGNPSMSYIIYERGS
jgi:abhydrolase domain-containing protein 6